MFSNLPVGLHLWFHPLHVVRQWFEVQLQRLNAVLNRVHSSAGVAVLLGQNGKPSAYFAEFVRNFVQW